MRQEIKSVRYKTVPIQLTGKEHEMIVDIKRRYAEHMNLARLSWDNFFVMITEEIKIQLNKRDKL